jgi:hypothetical protein
MITREQWRTIHRHPVVEWSMFAAGVLLIIAAAVVGPCPARAASSSSRPASRWSQDQHVGQAPLCPLQALAAQGRRWMTGACAAERERREALRKAAQASEQASRRP